MLDAVPLCRGPGFTLAGFTCTGHHRAWTATEVQDDVRLVLVRRGRFRRRVRGVDTDVDPTLGYLGVPGEEEQFAHPAGGDHCTSVSIASQLWHELAGDGTRPCRPEVYVDARLDLAHRRVIAAARHGEPGFAVVEELLGLVVAVLARVIDETTPADPRPDPARAVLVARAREAIAAAPDAGGGLVPLAGLLGVSPYRLSRAFSRELGVSLTRYRNRVRVGRAVDRIEGGARNLAVLAAELGFADQAHLARSVRAHLGHPPTAVRRLLSC